MATIHSISIKNFRGIKEFKQSFYKKKFICLVGRGDSGKSTILEAISLVLSSSWNISFYDNDFYNCDTTQPIEIEATLVDLPDIFIHEKFGLHLRGINSEEEIIDDFLEGEANINAITLKLTVTENLEPVWSIVNGRLNQEPISISASVRAKLNTFLISDYSDKHFTWNKGNPLYSLLQSEEKSDEEDKNIVLNALRVAKTTIDENLFKDFENVIKKISEKASGLGLDISKTNTSLDFKDINIKDNRVCLHDESNIPLRLKGKGMKRLVSIAIQLSLANDSGIILIDEIEQGLEPDRVKHLVSTLNNQNKSQIFITTHSSSVIEELDAENLFLLRKDEIELLNIDSSLQGCIRKNPNAIFAKKLIVCEGLTEIGICRAIDEYQISKGKDSIAFKGVVLADGSGSNLIEYSEKFRKLNFPVCLICDSDESSLNSKKPDLIKEGVIIIDCDTDKSIEYQIFKDLPWEGIKEIILYHIEENEIDSVKQSIQSFYEDSLPEDWQNQDTDKMREALAKVSNKKGWFKRIDHGEKIGSIICKYLDEMSEKRLKKQIEDIFNYIN